MTIHAGEKAARLRRATTSINAASPSQSDFSERPSTESTSHTDLTTPIKTPLFLRRSTSQSPTLPRRRSSSVSIKQKSVSNRVKTKQKHLASPTSNDQFIFSGLDPPHIIDSGSPSSSWNGLDLRQSMSVEDVLRNSTSAPSTLIFVQQRPKYQSTPTKVSQDKEADTSLDRETSGNTVSSPRQYFPWFLALTATTPTRSKASTDEASSVSPLQVEGKLVETDLSSSVERKKPSKKKNKSKRKAKSKATEAIHTEEATTREVSLGLTQLARGEQIVDNFVEETNKSNVAEASSSSLRLTDNISTADSMSTTQEDHALLIGSSDHSKWRNHSIDDK